jgi:hypothetical protein
MKIIESILSRLTVRVDWPFYAGGGNAGVNVNITVPLPG